jgi:hypothetical protein
LNTAIIQIKGLPAKYETARTKKIPNLSQKHEEQAEALEKYTVTVF